MKKVTLFILSTILVTSSAFAKDIEDNPTVKSSQKLKAISTNFYNKKVDYNWYGWQDYQGNIEIGNNYVILPGGKGRFQLSPDPTIINQIGARKFVCYRAINENGEECKISITCFVGGNCIIAVCFDQKSWAYKCSEPINFDFKPSHEVW